MTIVTTIQKCQTPELTKEQKIAEITQQCAEMRSLILANSVSPEGQKQALAGVEAAQKQALADLEK
jgi:hypothetical protein